MSWNYRVVKKVYESPFAQDIDVEPETLYEIHEVYYDDCGKVMAQTQNPIIIGNSIEELHDTLEKMNQALKKPVLDDPIK